MFRKLVWVAAIVALVGYLSVHPGLISDTVDRVRHSGGDSGGCSSQGNTTTHLLPRFSTGAYRSEVNPCFKYVDLLAFVTDKIPEPDRHEGGLHPVVDFLHGVKSFSEKLQVAKTVVTCGYQTDRLAIGVYQRKDSPWSVGVVTVIRGDLDAVAQVSVCYLIHQIESFPGGGDEQPQFCAEAVREKIDGQRYTVIWLGSTVTICNELDNQLTPGQGVLIKVSVDNGTDVQQSTPLYRHADRTGGTLARLTDGAIGRALCASDDRHDQDTTYKAMFNGTTGWIAEFDSNPKDNVDTCR